MPSVSSSGKRVALSGGGTTTSESVGEGGLDTFGGMAKPAAKGGEISSSGGGWEISDLDMSLSANGGLLSDEGARGVFGADTQGTTLVTTLDRNDGLDRAGPGGGFTRE